MFFGRTDTKAESSVLWPPHVKSWLIGKDFDAGRDWGRRRRGRQRMRWLDGITDSMAWVWVNSGSWWWTGRTGVLWFMGSQRVGHDWATELNWNFILNIKIVKHFAVSYTETRIKSFDIKRYFMLNITSNGTQLKHASQEWQPLNLVNWVKVNECYRHRLKL